MDRYTRSLEGIETPEPLVVTQFPITSVVPVCVFTRVVKCMLESAHSGGARACVRATACVDEAPCVSETTRVSHRVCE